ncbi:MAG: hypothetical protein KKA55_10480 [Proteobacteria bacterium]|nr:hypothetical protein [Pseudomonadota bacterium]MBU1595944.1 hypothetical protein [Pseudomonadota bacterium]
MGNMESRLSGLWMFVMFNYLYCDVVMLMDSGILSQFLSGKVDGTPITREFLLGAAILMEIPIAMTVLSKYLRHKMNRRANLAAGALMTGVQCATLFTGSTPAMYYLFFSAIEILCTAFIVWLAWSWREPDQCQARQT